MLHNKFIQLSLIIGAAAGIFILGFLLGGSLKSPTLQIDLGDVATWFGAFGTIAAILGAFWLAEHQQNIRNKEIEQQKINEKERVIKLIAMLMREAIWTVARLDALWKKKKYSTVQEISLPFVVHLKHQFLEIPIIDIASTDLSKKILYTPQSLGIVEAKIKDHCETEKKTNEKSHEYVQGMIDVVLQTLKKTAIEAGVKQPDIDLIIEKTKTSGNQVPISSEVDTGSPER
jgi:hypothetical protein